MRPLIFIHEGKQPYLKTAIKCAKEQGNEVYLIGDEANQEFCNNWCAIDSLDKTEYDDFCKIYVHMSSNSEWFELLCFRRFFLLYEFAKNRQLEEFILCDSDLLVFSDLSQYDYKDCDVAVSFCEEQPEMDWTASAHCSFWTMEALRKFIDYFVNVYKKRKDKLNEKWEWHKNNGIIGGICDMTLLWLWINEDATVRVRNTSCIDEHGMVFDYMAGFADGQKKNEFIYNSFLKCKKVIFKNKNPFFVRVEAEDKVQALTIHAQGERKKYIAALYWRKDALVFWLFSALIYKIHNRIRKLIG